MGHKKRTSIASKQAHVYLHGGGAAAAAPAAAAAAAAFAAAVASLLGRGKHQVPSEILLHPKENFTNPPCALLSRHSRLVQQVLACLLCLFVSYTPQQ